MPAIAISALVAAAFSVLTILLLPSISTIPRRSWTTKVLGIVVLRSMLASMLGGLVGLRATGNLRVAIGCGAFGACVSIARFWLQYRTVRKARVYSAMARDPAKREEAIRQLLALLERTRPTTRTAPDILSAWVTAALLAAGELSDRGSFEDADLVIGQVTGLTLGPIRTANHAVIVAIIRVHLGDVAAASAALDSIVRPVAVPIIEAMVVSTQALVMSLDGREDLALSTLAGWKWSDTWHLRSRLEARAHALAAKDEAGARNALFELERRFGGVGLECVIRVKGPASELAREVKERKQPAPPAEPARAPAA